MSKADTALDQALILSRLPNSWRYQDGWLLREYRTDGWRTTTLLVNAIAFLAEQSNHHPDLEVHWGSVSVRLQSHDAAAVTERDLNLAERIEALARGTEQADDSAPGWLIT